MLCCPEDESGLLLHYHGKRISVGTPPAPVTYLGGLYYRPLSSATTHSFVGLRSCKWMSKLAVGEEYKQFPVPSWVLSSNAELLLPKITQKAMFFYIKANRWVFAEDPSSILLE